MVAHASSWQAAGSAVVALHGWEFPLPGDAELAGTSGHARQGWMLLARGREPLARVAWRRHDATPDLDRSLDKAGEELCRRGGCQRLTVRRAVGDHQRQGEWDGPTGTWHAAVRYFPGTQLTLAVTALVPDLAVAELMAAAQAQAPDAPWRWCAYGLDADLPSWWRLVGMQAYAGLVRAVWDHRPQERFRADALVVLRRHACAARLLAGRDPAAWLAAGLDRPERIEAQSVADEVVRLVVSRPAAIWWQRIRGRRDQRVLHAWQETEADRLVVQEWRGDGEPLPCLRRAAAEAMA